MKKKLSIMWINNRICPYCGAELSIEYIPSGESIYFFDCCVCGGTFKHTKEELDSMSKEESYSQKRYRSNRTSGWNGFTDPDDFPSDGFDGGGW